MRRLRRARRLASSISASTRASNSSRLTGSPGRGAAMGESATARDPARAQRADCAARSVWAPQNYQVVRKLGAPARPHRAPYAPPGRSMSRARRRKALMRPTRSGALAQHWGRLARHLQAAERGHRPEAACFANSPPLPHLDDNHSRYHHIHSGIDRRRARRGQYWYLAGLRSNSQAESDGQTATLDANMAKG